MARYKNAVSLVDMSDSDLCNFGWKIALENPTTAVRFVRGHKMRTLDDLLNEMSAACQFPYYFGENYAALGECLADLGWLNAERFVLIISNASELLADEPIEMKAFVRALTKGVDEFTESKKNALVTDSLFQVIFHSANFSDADRKSPLAEFASTS